MDRGRSNESHILTEEVVNLARRVKRVTMYKADQPPFSAMETVLRRLEARDLAKIAEDKSISVFPAAAAEELDSGERLAVYRLLGYEAPDEDKPLIAKRAGVVGGRAAVAGTRIPVWQIANCERNGVSLRELRMQYGLSDRQISQALAYAEQHEEEINRDVFENERVAMLAGAERA